MADLSVLIRLHKHELDEKRRGLAALYSEMAELERARRELERAFQQERDAVSASPSDVHYTFARYAEEVKHRRQDLNKAETALERQIELARDGMMETFSELKKYEMTQEERERLEEDERRFREAQEMDNIGLESFRRKEKEE